MRQIWRKSDCLPLACGGSEKLQPSPQHVVPFSWARGTAQTGAPQLLQCTTNRAILSSFPWQLKQGLTYLTLQQGVLVLLCWPGCNGGQPQITEKTNCHSHFLSFWQGRSCTEFHLSAERSPICTASLISWQKRFFLSPQLKEQGKDWISSILLPQLMGSSYFLQRVQAVCASPKEKNNKQFKTCQDVSKLLTEQLFKATWVTYKMRLSPRCGTQAE